MATLRELYETIIEIGIENDPRGKEGVEKQLNKLKKSYESFSENEKKYFDKEKLKNPYSDSRIYNGKGDEEIKNLMIGIDIETQELLLADKLKEKGQKIDAVMTHHPEGIALVALHEVMELQADILHKFGVPINIAEGIMSGRIGEVAKGLLPINYERSVKAAKMLQIPYLGAHTPADNCVATYLQNLFDKKKPETIGEVIDLLLEIPEYQISYKDGNGPIVVAGKKSDRAGKIYIDMTGGTEGSHDALEKLSHAGVGTIIGMHMSKEHLKQAEKNHIRVIIAGHMASDALGINLMLDQIEKKHGNLNIIECSGFSRIKR